jgi:EF hand
MAGRYPSGRETASDGGSDGTVRLGRFTGINQAEGNATMRYLTAAAATALAALAAGTAMAQEGPGNMMGGFHAGPGDMMGGFHGEIDIVAIDTDGDGVLTRAELQAHAVERLARADANGDGSLDRVELVALMPAPRGGFLNVFAEDPAERMADRLIALMGGTETGRVEVAALADRRVNALLAMADADRDAAISLEEAEAAADRLDRPGPWHERMREHGRGGQRGGGDGPHG